MNPEILTLEQKQIMFKNELDNLFWTEIIDDNFGAKYYIKLIYKKIYPIFMI
jgi:hypothetical protein